MIFGFRNQPNNIAVLAAIVIEYVAEMALSKSDRQEGEQSDFRHRNTGLYAANKQGKSDRKQVPQKCQATFSVQAQLGSEKYIVNRYIIIVKRLQILAKIGT